MLPQSLSPLPSSPSSSRHCYHLSSYSSSWSSSISTITTTSSSPSSPCSSIPDYQSYQINPYQPYLIPSKFQIKQLHQHQPQQQPHPHQLSPLLGAAPVKEVYSCLASPPSPSYTSPTSPQNPSAVVPWLVPASSCSSSTSVNLPPASTPPTGTRSRSGSGSGSGFGTGAGTGTGTPRLLERHTNAINQPYNSSCLATDCEEGCWLSPPAATPVTKKRKGSDSCCHSNQLLPLEENCHWDSSANLNSSAAIATPISSAPISTTSSYADLLAIQLHSSGHKLGTSAATAFAKKAEEGEEDDLDRDSDSDSDSDLESGSESGADTATEIQSPISPVSSALPDLHCLGCNSSHSVMHNSTPGSQSSRGTSSTRRPVHDSHLDQSTRCSTSSSTSGECSQRHYYQHQLRYLGHLQQQEQQPSYHHRNHLQQPPHRLQSLQNSTEAYHLPSAHTSSPAATPPFWSISNLPTLGPPFLTSNRHDQKLRKAEFISDISSLYGDEDQQNDSLLSEALRTGESLSSIAGSADATKSGAVLTAAPESASAPEYPNQPQGYHQPQQQLQVQNQAMQQQQQIQQAMIFGASSANPNLSMTDVNVAVAPAGQGTSAFDYQGEIGQSQFQAAQHLAGLTTANFGQFTGITPSTYQQTAIPGSISGYTSQSPPSMFSRIVTDNDPSTTTAMAAAAPYEFMHGGTPYMPAAQGVPPPPPQQQPLDTNMQQAQQQQIQGQLQQQAQLQLAQQQVAQQQQFVADDTSAAQSDVHMYASSTASSELTYSMLSPLAASANPEHCDYTQALLGMGNGVPSSHSCEDESFNAGVFYSCTYYGCERRLNSALQLHRHKREHHRTSQLYRRGDLRNTQIGPHRCRRINPTTGRRCDTVFSRPYDLTRHEDTIHNIRRPKMKCCFCSAEKTYSRNDALTRHMRSVHPDIYWPGKIKRRARRSKKNTDGDAKTPPAKKEKTSEKDDGSEPRAADDDDDDGESNTAGTVGATVTSSEAGTAPSPEIVSQDHATTPEAPQLPEMSDMPDFENMPDMDIAIADMAEMTVAMTMTGEQGLQQEQQQQ